MKRFFILILLLLSTGVCQAEKKTDSLFLELNNIKDNEKRLDFLLEKIETYHNSDPQLALIYAKKYFSQAKVLGVKEDIAKAFWRLASINHRLEKMDSAVLNFLEAIKLYRELDFQESMANGINNIGDIFMDVNEYEKAYQYFYDAVEIYQQLGAKNKLVNTYRNLSRCFRDDKKYEQAIKYGHKALDLAIQIRDQFWINSLQNSIGIIYYYQMDYPKAREYYLKTAEKFGENENREWRLGMAYNNIGETYMEEGNFAKAHDYFQQALERKRKYGRASFTASTLLNLGKLALREGKSEKAILPLKEAIASLNPSVYSSTLNEALALLNQAYKLENEKGVALDYTELITYNEMLSRQLNLLSTLKAEIEEFNGKYVLQNSFEKYELEASLGNLKNRNLYFIVGGIIILLIFMTLIYALSRALKRAEEKALDVDLGLVQMKEILGQTFKKFEDNDSFTITRKDD